MQARLQCRSASKLRLKAKEDGQDSQYSILQSGHVSSLLSNDCQDQSMHAEDSLEWEASFCTERYM